MTAAIFPGVLLTSPGSENDRDGRSCKMWGDQPSFRSADNDRSQTWMRCLQADDLRDCVLEVYRQSDPPRRAELPHCALHVDCEG